MRFHISLFLTVTSLKILLLRNNLKLVQYFANTLWAEGFGIDQNKLKFLKTNNYRWYKILEKLVTETILRLSAPHV